MFWKCIWGEPALSATAPDAGVFPNGVRYWMQRTPQGSRRLLAWPFWYDDLAWDFTARCYVREVCPIKWVQLSESRNAVARSWRPVMPYQQY